MSDNVCRFSEALPLAFTDCHDHYPSVVFGSKIPAECAVKVITDGNPVFFRQLCLRHVTKIGDHRERDVC